MKTYLLIIAFLFGSFTLFSQTSGIIWKKDLPHNFDTAQTGIIFQGLTTDSSNNIYLCYSLNNSDTSSSIFFKYSPSGELLWRRTLLPNNEFRSVWTQFDYEAKLYIDQDQHLVFLAKGYDTVTHNELLLYKFDTNGNIISQGGIGGVTTSLTWDDMDKQVDPVNGNIYFPLFEMGDDSEALRIFCFDKDFNFKFNTEYKYYKTTHGTMFNPNYIHYGIVDSFILIQTSDYLGGFTDFQCINLYTNQLKFIYSVPLFLNFTKFYKVGPYFIFSDASGIVKFDGNGNQLYDKLGDTRCSFIDNNLLYYETINYSSPLYIPTSSSYSIYDPYTDATTTTPITLPSVIAPISGSIQKRDNILYSIGSVMDDTIKALNGIRTTYFAKLDNFGIPTSHFFSTLTNPGWTLNGLATCLDHDNNIVCFQTVAKPNDSTPSRTLHYIIKGSFNNISNLNGTCYTDVNSNCNKDSFEHGIQNNIIHLLPEDIYTSTDSNGNYSFSKFDGFANVKLIPINNSALCDSMYTISCNDSIINNNLNFGYQPSSDFFCNASIHDFISRPGFQTQINCFVKNANLNTIHDVQLAVILDSVFQFDNTNISYDSVSGHSIYFHLDSIGVNEIKNIVLSVTASPSAPLGYSYSNFLFMSSEYGADKCNLSDTTTGILVGSFDPNDKKNYPIGQGLNHMVSNDTRLKYTIRFQNTGTDTAFNVRIHDIVDDDLDISTFKILGYSHPMTFSLENRQLKFNFKNIYLPDSNKNQLLSNGYIEYSILPKPNIDGAKILNKADIYFDFNPPVTTNTTFNTIGNYRDPLSIIPLNFTLFPNPIASSLLNIKAEIQKTGEYSILISDMMGRVVKKVFQNKRLSEGTQNMKVDISGISAGLYLVHLKSSEQNVHISKKLVVGN